jgi:hypothetical protein
MAATCSIYMVSSDLSMCDLRALMFINTSCFEKVVCLLSLLFNGLEFFSSLFSSISIS